jgi:hypothetical protein
MHETISFIKMFQLEITTFLYWPIEYNPKASFIKVFQFEKTTLIYLSLNAFENLDLCECVNLHELLTCTLAN